MGVKIMLKNDLQQKLVNTFPADVQGLQYGCTMT